MKKIICLLLLLFCITACGVQPQPTQNVSDVVNSTLTAIAQSSLQPSAPQTTPPATISASPMTLSDTPMPPAPTPANYAMICVADWFFAFDNLHPSLGSFCPQPAKILAAVGQDFQGGRALRYAPDPSYLADQRGTVYIIYNDGEWITFPDIWDASQPIDDPSLPIPKGFYQPIRGIGKVWRDNAEVHDRLGFAYEPENAFSGRMQLYAAQPGQPQGDSHFIFLDHGKWGLVLLLNSVDMGPNKWEVVGAYTPTTRSFETALPAMLPMQTNNMYGIPYDSSEWLIIPNGRDDNPTRFNILVRSDDINCKITINTKTDFSGLSEQKSGLVLGSRSWVILKTYQGDQQIDEIYYPDKYSQEYREGGGVDGNGYAAAGFYDSCRLSIQKTLFKMP